MQINIIELIFIRIIQYILKILKRFRCFKFIQKKLYEYYYTYMEYLLKPYFVKAQQNINKDITFKGVNNSSIIWMFWWQGVNQMPNIVKGCIKSIKRNSNGHKVILITKDNIKQFTKLPKIIYIKLNKRKIDFTHFSDILRFNVLNQYGGLWADSTMYCTSPITSKYFNYLYTTGGYNSTVPKFVKGRWAEFLIGGNSNNNMLSFVDNFLQLYFSKNNFLINYFLADYALDYSYNHNLGNYKYYVNNIAKGANPHLFTLVNLLNKSYKYNEFKYITEDTNMFKLTYKHTFNKNNDTFYRRLINNKL